MDNYRNMNITNESDADALSTLVGISLTDDMNSTGTDDNPWGSMPMLVRATIQMTGIATPIIASLGIIGNILSAVIFFEKRLRKTSCSLYLAARAISDMGFLFCLLITWFDNIRARIFHTVPTCQITVFLTYVCGFLSVWLVVFVTAENYVRVCKPFSVQKYCNPKWARVLIVIWLVLACVFYNEALWVNHVALDALNNTSCEPNERFALVTTIVTNGDTVVTLVIPSVILLALMGMITYCIIVTYRERNANLTNCGSADLQAKVTRMLFWTSFCFLLLNLPSHSIRIFLLMRQLTTSVHKLTEVEYFIQQLLQLVYYASFAVNFIVYIALGESFRKTFITKFCACVPTAESRYVAVPTQVTQMTMDNKSAIVCTTEPNSPVANGNRMTSTQPEELELKYDEAAL